MKKKEGNDVKLIVSGCGSSPLQKTCFAGV